MGRAAFSSTCMGFHWLDGEDTGAQQQHQRIGHGKHKIDGRQEEEEQLTPINAYYSRADGRRACYCTGLGLDPRTGMCKVVQALYRSRDRTSMGMEVFTIAGVNDHGGCFIPPPWKKIKNDPPYPARRSFTGRPA